jgi:hypothetical protein
MSDDQRKAGLAPAFPFEFHELLLTPAADRQQTVDDSKHALEISARSAYVPDLAPLASGPDFPAKRA